MAVAWPCSVPMAPELMLPLMLGSIPMPTSTAQRDSADCPWARASAAPASSTTAITEHTAHLPSLRIHDLRLAHDCVVEFSDIAWRRTKDRVRCTRLSERLVAF